MLRLLSNSKIIHNSKLSKIYLTPHNTIIKEVCKQLNYKNEKYCLETITKPKIIPEVHSIIEDKYFIYYEMEYMKGGDLLDNILKRDYSYIDRVSLYPTSENKDFDETNKVLMKSMINLLLQVKKSSIIHLDIKPENFVFTDTNANDLRIIDFGSSKIYDFNNKNELYISEIIGTQFYMSPEYYWDNVIVYNTDIWSLGIILLILETGKNIFNNNENYELYYVKEQSEIDNLIDKYVDENKKSNNLIKNMLKLDYNERYDYDDILKHSYLN